MSGGRLHYRLAEYATRFARESWSLAKIIPSLRRDRSWRVACLELTLQDGNELARSILKTDKEFHLFRYHGLRNYIELRKEEGLGDVFLMPWVQPYLSRNALTVNNNKPQQQRWSSSSNTNDNCKTSKVAKVPFVITTAMKSELAQELGYTPSDMKKMTPLVATLLIQHKVDPKDMETRLPELIKQHEEKIEQIRQEHELEQQKLREHEEEQQREQQKQQLDEKRQQQLDEKQQQEEEQNQSEKPPDFPQLPFLKLEKVENACSKTDYYKVPPPAPTKSATEKIAWYRVVEEVHYNNKIIDVPVGLHRTMEQAQQDCNLRQELADRNHKDDRSSPKRHFRILTPADDI